MTLTDYLREKVLHDLSLLKSETVNPVEKEICKNAMELLQALTSVTKER
jgi:hypothetical protein